MHTFQMSTDTYQVDLQHLKTLVLSLLKKPSASSVGWYCVLKPGYKPCGQEEDRGQILSAF